MVVSTMSRPAGSVAVSARPIFPNTCSTSGKVEMILSVCWSISRAFATDTPGKVVGMYSRSPSNRDGMNSEPSLRKGMTVANTISTAPATTLRGWRSTQATTGRYRRMRKRLMGFLCSGRIFPRMNAAIRIGTMVIARMAEAAMD